MEDRRAVDVLGFTLGDRIRKAREKAELDQDELADRIGVSRGTVGNYEHNRGKKPPKSLVLRAWAYECGVSYEELVGPFATSLQRKGTRPDNHEYRTVAGLAA